MVGLIFMIRSLTKFENVLFAEVKVFDPTVTEASTPRLVAVGAKLRPATSVVGGGSNDTVIASEPDPLEILSDFKLPLLLIAAFSPETLFTAACTSANEL